MFTRLKNLIRRSTEGVQNAASLTVDQQYERLDARLKKELDAETKRLRSQYPSGWFRMVSFSGSETLSHWCPDCKTLSQGKTALHCGSRKRDKRPEGWRLRLLPTARPVLYS
jgi:Leu/Phe-tRNA-protein transferase